MNEDKPGPRHFIGGFRSSPPESVGEAVMAEAAKIIRNERYLKQVIVVRKDLSMPTGKLAAIVAHASMSFLVGRLQNQPHLRVSREREGDKENLAAAWFSDDEWQWLTEPDPGLESVGQLSFAKIVCAVDSEDALRAVYDAALDAGLVAHTVFDSGYSHNKLGDFAAVAIGPAWPEQLHPITGGLKVYR